MNEWENPTYPWQLEKLRCYSCLIATWSPVHTVSLDDKKQFLQSQWAIASDPWMVQTEPKFISCIKAVDNAGKICCSFPSTCRHSTNDANDTDHELGAWSLPLMKSCQTFTNVIWAHWKKQPESKEQTASFPTSARRAEVSLMLSSSDLVPSPCLWWKLQRKVHLWGQTSILGHHHPVGYLYGSKLSF